MAADGIPQSFAVPTQKPRNAIFKPSIQGTACFAGIPRYRLIFVNARRNIRDLRIFAVTAENSSSASGEIRFSTWSLHYQFITLVCRGSYKVLGGHGLANQGLFIVSVVDVVAFLNSVPVASPVLPDFASYSLTKPVKSVLGKKVHIPFHSWSRRSRDSQSGRGRDNTSLSSGIVLSSSKSVCFSTLLVLPTRPLQRLTCMLGWVYLRCRAASYGNKRERQEHTEEELHHRP
jgi:hypothetical protein